jgi:hypothetical protein
MTADGKVLLATTGLALALPLSAHALDAAHQGTLSVKVFPDRYVAAGKSFADPEALAAWAQPSRGRVLLLDTCGVASIGQLLAAVQRFHSEYTEGIQIRTFGAGEPACVATVAQAAQGRVSAAPADLPYYASDQSGRSLVP